MNRTKIKILLETLLKHDRKKKEKKSCRGVKRRRGGDAQNRVDQNSRSRRFSQSLAIRSESSGSRLLARDGRDTLRRR
jgi:hypothetical protein